MAKHPRVLEAIANAKIAAASTRGMYPYTPATNVFTIDGTPLETETENEEVIDGEEPEDDGEESPVEG